MWDIDSHAALTSDVVEPSPLGLGLLVFHRVLSLI